MHVTELGLPINPDKLSPPCISLICLSITINLDCHTLGTEYSKTKAISNECCGILGKTYLSKNKFQSLLLKLLHIHKYIRPARIFISRMLSLLKANHKVKKIKLTNGFFQNLHWFVKFIPSFNGSTYFSKAPISMDNQVLLPPALQVKGFIGKNRVYATPVFSIMGFKLGIVGNAGNV